MKKLIWALCLVSNFCFADTVYSLNQLNRVQQVSAATVVSIRPVTVKGEPSGVGKYTGAGIGAVSAMGIAGGSPYGQVVATIAGAVFGGAIGNAYDVQNATSQAYEITMQSGKNSSLFSIVQPDLDNMQIGDQVFLTAAQDGTIRAYRP